MDTPEFAARKQQLQQDLLAVLETFREETQVCVTGIHLKTESIYHFDSPARADVHISELAVDVG